MPELCGHDRKMTPCSDKTCSSSGQKGVVGESALSWAYTHGVRLVGEGDEKKKKTDGRLEFEGLLDVGIIVVVERVHKLERESGV